MGKKPNLNKLNYLFDKESFELTDTKYEKLTGVPMPKRKSYLKNDSAFAKKCKELGFVIVEVQEKKVFVTRRR